MRHVGALSGRFDSTSSTYSFFSSKDKLILVSDFRFSSLFRRNSFNFSRDIVACLLAFDGLRPPPRSPGSCLLCFVFTFGAMKISFSRDTESDEIVAYLFEVKREDPSGFEGATVLTSWFFKCSCCKFRLSSAFSWLELRRRFEWSLISLLSEIGWETVGVAPIMVVEEDNTC